MGRPTSQRAFKARTDMGMDNRQTDDFQSTKVVLYGQKATKTCTGNVIFRSYLPRQTRKHILFGHHFWQSKAKWANKNHSRYLRAKHLYKKRTFSNAQTTRDSFVNTTSDIFHFHRPNLRVLARSHKHQLSKVPRVQILRQVLQISSHALRTVHSPKAIHFDHAQCSKGISKTRYKNIHLPRRYTGGGDLDRGHVRKEINCTKNTSQIWTFSKLDKIRTHPDSNNSLSRTDVGFNTDDSNIRETPSKQYLNQNKYAIDKQKSQSQRDAISSRLAGACLLRYENLKTPIKTAIQDGSTYETQDKDSKDSSRGRLLFHSSTDKSKVIKTPEITNRTISGQPIIHGCILERMGSGSHLYNPASNSSRYMEGQEQILPHSDTRGKSHISGTSELQMEKEPESSSFQRLQANSGSSQQRRLNEIVSTSPPNNQDLDSCDTQEDHCNRPLYPRKEKHPSRPAIKETSMPPGGMVSQQASVRVGLKTRTKATNRPLRFRLEQKATELLHLIQKPRHPVHRRLQHRLEPVAGNIPIPSTSHDSTSSQKTQNIHRPSFTGFPRMAEQTMVPSHNPVNTQHTTHPIPGCVAGTPGLSNPQLTKMLARLKFRDFYSFLLNKIYPKSIADVMLQSIRDNTFKTYKTGFEMFQRWINSNNITTINQTQVMLFMRHLLDKQQSISTIKVYKSALSNILLFGFGIDLNNKPMDIFIRGIGNIGYKPINISNWNPSKVANLILNSTDCSLKFLTQKTLFLVLIACGRRISDTLASVRTKHFLKFSPDNSTMIIHYAPNYRFKNDSTGERPLPIHLKRYQSILLASNSNTQYTASEDKLCPVMNVESYLHATRDTNCAFLFVNPNNTNNPLNARQAANLIQDLVRQADPLANFTIRNTREYASTQGWLFGASCSVLKSSCHWSSLQMFIKTYFKAQSVIEPRLASLNQLP